MVRLIKVAATQMKISTDPAANLVGGGLRTDHPRLPEQLTEPSRSGIAHQAHSMPLQAKAEKMVRSAAAAGAQVILLQVSSGPAGRARMALCSVPCMSACGRSPPQGPLSAYLRHCRSCLRTSTSARSRSRCAGAGRRPGDPGARSEAAAWTPPVWPAMRESQSPPLTLPQEYFDWAKPLEKSEPVQR
jgi:hypothetical protein